MMKRSLLVFSLALVAACSSATRPPSPTLRTDVAAGPTGGTEVWVIERLSGLIGPAGDVHAGLVTRVAERDVPLPLERTDVKGKVGLHVASVTMAQRFTNPYDGKIEAVYVFPLPQDAAVTDFLMTIGDRTIRGIIREREEARRIYEEAKRQGYVASLMTQERPNVFTQNVANIEPGRSIDVTLTYFHSVRYEDGVYELVLPLVVGPRFTPPGTAKAPGGPWLKPGSASSHRVAITLEIDAGFPMDDLACPTHRVTIARTDERRAMVTLDATHGVPNRDFVLRWAVAREHVEGAVITQTKGEDGWFTMVLQPPRDVRDVPARAREMIFVVDCSGSMDGEPLAACKRAMRRCLDRLDPRDTFQIIRFSNDASSLGDRPLRATPDNVARGRRYVDSLRADGGTMMLNGIRAALRFPHDAERYRIVSFMTDGFIGNETEILAAIHKDLGAARIFSFGVGSSVNRYLLERMAQEGRGLAAYVRLDDSGTAAVDALYRRVEQPALTDIEIDWNGLGARDVEPARLPDLFVGRPMVLAGRFPAGAGPTTVRVRGRQGDRTVTIEVPFDPSGAHHDALDKLWARARIASLSDNLYRVEGDASRRELEGEIEAVALRHGLVSAFTAFIAVDSLTRTEGDHGTTVPVAVPVPEGTRYETTVK
jgi:Ca-activated chloride channel family protein